MKILKRDMNDNELMRGNLVYADGEVCRIQSIGHGEWVGVWNFAKEDTDNLLIHELSPIPITEELLKKNGFDNSDFIMGPGCFDLYADDNLSLRVTNEIDEYPNGCFLALVYGKDGNLIAELGYSKHLHQLQNLCNIAGVDMEWKV